MQDEVQAAAEPAGWDRSAADRFLTLALYQPDIPQNCGTMLRMCACLGLHAAIIEPAGFPVTDKHFRRAGMDYLENVKIDRHVSWTAFALWRQNQRRRLILLSTKAAMPYTGFQYLPGDVLLVGRESAGVPDEVHAAADARVLIPLRPPLRSLNVAVAAAMVAGEALRQLADVDSSGNRAPNLQTQSLHIQGQEG
jgi:tRNA (cytidine/uridine-2'-O-)-methyltransferase